jgi:hypothetical protein
VSLRERKKLETRERIRGVAELKSLLILQFEGLRR